MEFTASSIMRSKLVTSNVSDNLKGVAKKMFDENVASVLVKQKGEIIGIIIDRDILKAIVDNKDFTSTLAGEIMSSPLDCCDADDTLERCNELFDKTKHSRLVVRKGENYSFRFRITAPGPGQYYLAFQMVKDGVFGMGETAYKSIWVGNAS